MILMGGSSCCIRCYQTLQDNRRQDSNHEAFVTVLVDTGRQKEGFRKTTLTRLCGSPPSALICPGCACICFCPQPRASGILAFSVHAAQRCAVWLSPFFWPSRFLLVWLGFNGAYYNTSLNFASVGNDTHCVAHISGRRGSPWTATRHHGGNTHPGRYSGNGGLRSARKPAVPVHDHGSPAAADEPRIR